MKNPDLLHTASEQFLGKKEHEIKSTVLQTLEGHLRAILGKRTRIVRSMR
jgi:flotillin